MTELQKYDQLIKIAKYELCNEIKMFRRMELCAKRIDYLLKKIKEYQSKYDKIANNHEDNMFIYTVYDKDELPVIVGTLKEVADYLEVNKSTITRGSTQHLCVKNHTIERIKE